MIPRILSSGSYSDVCGYVTRQYHDPKKYGSDTWRIIDSEGVATHDFRRMVQSLEAVHGMMPGKENPAGHISISFDKRDNPRLTDGFITQLAREYLDGMGIRNTQFMVVRHLETGHQHFHIVYNRVNLDGQAVDERNNFRKSNRVCQAMKNKYGLTFSDLKQKYEDRLPEFKEKIRAALYRCPSWDVFSRRLANAGIKVKFHDDRETGQHIGVKFTDGDITLKGSKIDRAFTYRRLDNYFKANERMQMLPEPQSPGLAPEPIQPDSTLVEEVVETVVESTAAALGDLFKVGPGETQEEAEFRHRMQRQQKKTTRTVIRKPKR